MSMIFKVKKSISDDKSAKVDRTKKNFEPPDLANIQSNISVNEYIDFWQTFRNDLVELSEIIKNRKKGDKEDDLWFMRKNVWDEK